MGRFKIVETFISDLLTCYLNVNKVLSNNQSGFHKKHITTTAVLKVLNDYQWIKVIIALPFLIYQRFSIMIMKYCWIMKYCCIIFKKYLSEITQCV